MKEHLKYLDGLRGLASFAVILFHMDFFIGTMTSPSPGYGQDSYLWQVYRRLLDGNFSVCVFFVLSGYSLILSYYRTNNEKYLSEAVFKRYLRLTPLVAASVIMSFLLWHNDLYFNKAAASLIGGHDWFYNNFNGNPNFLDAIYQAILGVYLGNVSFNGPLWTIKIEFWASLFLFAFCTFFYNQKKVILISLITVFALILCLGVSGLYTSLFIAGALMLKMKMKRDKRLALLIMPAMLLGTENRWSTVSAHSDSFLSQTLQIDVTASSIIFHSIGACLLLIAVLNSSALQKLLSLRPFEFLGKISFSMYVFHLPVVMSVGSWIMVYFYGSYGKVVASALAIIVSIVVTLIISKLAYLLIDIPSQKLAKKLAKKVIS